MIKMKSQKGAITLYTLVAMLFLSIFLMSVYVMLSNRYQTQLEATQEIAKQYQTDLTAEDVYNSFFENSQVVPIYTAYQLSKVASGENISITEENGKMYKFDPSYTYVLMNDIDLNPGKYQINSDGTVTFSSDATQWTPIGTDENPFTGTFEGMNHSINGIYINNNKNYQGLFGYATGNIKNTIVSGNITAKDAVGGIVGTLEGNATNVDDGTISNCTNNITIKGNMYLGGIVGYKTYGKIENCINNGNIISDITQNTYYIGGITGVGQANSIINCTNNGNISGTRYIGGISGISNVEFCTISNCTNTGEVSGETVIAGIVGRLDGNINNCHNKGNITATVTIIRDAPESAGIVDIIIQNVIIEQCSNSGNITSINSDTTLDAQCRAGGIYGTDGNGGAIIKKCYNTGKISTINRGISNYGSLSGGIGVYASNQTIIENCYNMGIVTSNLDNDDDYVSGILGVAFNAKIINTYNGQNLISKNNNDRISGITAINSSSTLIIENCYYLENTAPVGINNIYGCVNVSGQAEVRSAEYMKSKYFVNDLGSENWKIVPGVNNGYPILRWQDGTETSPEFETVSTAQALKDFAMIVNEKGETFSGKTVTQLTDIDLSSVCSATVGNWTPIGDYKYINTSLYFAGTFNGDYHTIKSLYINNNDVEFIAMFGYNKGTIEKLTISETRIIGNNYVSGICVRNDGKILDCANMNGSIYGGGHDPNASGICSDNFGTIANCYNTSEIKGNGYHIGGIAGSNDKNGTITNCYNVGKIDVQSKESSAAHTGGIAGCNIGIISNCYSTADVVDGIGFNGPIIGWQCDFYSDNTTKKVSNCYYLEQEYQGDPRIDVGEYEVEVRSSEYMKSKNFVNDLGSENWKIVSGVNNGYPILSWQDGTATNP